jgi:branched-chain amino acid transport system substrate-binding protein
MGMRARSALLRKAVWLGLTVVVLLARPGHSQIVIAVLAPQSGQFGDFGAEVAGGASVAAEEINAAGGINGQKVQVLVVDDQCRPDQAVAAVRRAIQVDRARAIVGAPCTAAAFAVRDETRSLDVLAIVLATGSTVTNPDARHLLRLMGREDRLAGMVADHLAVAYRGRKLGRLITGQTPFGASLAAAMQNRGLAFAETAEQPGELPAWASSVDVVVASVATPLGLLGQIVERTSADLLVATPVLSGQLLSLVRGSERVVVLANPPTEAFPRATTLVKLAQERKIPTGGYFAYAAASMQIAVQLIAAAPKDGGRRQAERAREKNLPSAIGEFRFDSNGDPIDWRFTVNRRSALGVAAIDVCKASNCKEYKHCPPDCPK